MEDQKGLAIKVIESLPDDCTLEDIQYHLYVVEKVERGIRDFEQGKIHTIEEVRQKVEEWQRSAGQTRP